MTLKATVCSGFAAIASALVRATASALPMPKAIAPAAPAAAGDADASVPTESGESAFYTVDVALMPYGPDVMHFWIPTSVANHTPSEIRNGDFA